MSHVNLVLTLGYREFFFMSFACILLLIFVRKKIDELNIWSKIQFIRLTLVKKWKSVLPFFIQIHKRACYLNYTYVHVHENSE